MYRPAYASAQAPAASGAPIGLILGGYACFVAGFVIFAFGFGSAGIGIGVRCFNQGSKINGVFIMVLGAVLILLRLMTIALLASRH